MGRGTVAASGSPRIGAPRRSATAASAADAPARATRVAGQHRRGARGRQQLGGPVERRGIRRRRGRGAAPGTCGGGAGRDLDVERQAEHHRAARRLAGRAHRQRQEPRAGPPARVTSHAPLASGRDSSTSSPPEEGLPGQQVLHLLADRHQQRHPARAAFRIPDIALARPGWTWTFTAARLPGACA